MLHPSLSQYPNHSDLGEPNETELTSLQLANPDVKGKHKYIELFNESP
jgi:hypothetical protein